MSPDHTTDETTGVTRRQVLRVGVGSAIAAGGLGVPFTVERVAATDSGEVEVTTDAEIFSNTSIDVTIREYDDEGDSTPRNTETRTIDNGQNTYVLDTLEGASGWYFDADITWNTSDVTVTPILHSVTVAVPANADYAFRDYTTEVNWRAPPTDVDDQGANNIIVYDEGGLLKYEPALVTNAETRSRYKGLFGYVVKSSDYDHNIYCYWAQLTHQTGSSVAGFVFGPDSHLGDHEPIYVYVDRETGDVVKFVYSAYHHYAGMQKPEDGDLAQVRAGFPTHGIFEVNPNWHNYSWSPNQDDWAFASEWSSLNDWPAHRDEWANNGFYVKTDAGAIEDPQEVEQRGQWWEKGTTGYQLGSLWYSLGFAGAESSDDLIDQ